MSDSRMPPLILTLMLDSAAFACLDNLRKEHFPPERNFLPAHITLFHALPGEREEQISQLLRYTADRQLMLELSFPEVRFLGRGVALTVESRELVAVREELAAAWHDQLGPQDRQRYKPHVTIQNKVDAERARALHRRLSSEWGGLRGRGEGLLLWRYLGGPWELIEEYRFTGRPQTASAETDATA